MPAVRRPISAGPIVRYSRASPVEVYGETNAAVETVVLHYSLPGGGRVTTRAVLVEATDRRALDAAGIREPFGYFVGGVQAAARRVFAEALDESGRRIGVAAYRSTRMPGAAFIAEKR